MLENEACLNPIAASKKRGQKALAKSDAKKHRENNGITA